MPRRPTWMPVSYSDGLDKLSGKPIKKIGYETTLRHEKGNVIVKYFLTDIVCFFHDGDTYFRFYNTPTTRSRLNCVSPHIGFTTIKHDPVVMTKGINIRNVLEITIGEAWNALEAVE